MGYVVGLLPVTGVTLPLISAGGTSLVLTLAVVGLLVRFARAEPDAIEHLRAHRRAHPARRLGRLGRWLVPVPEHAVAPLPTLGRRSVQPPAAEGRPGRRPTGRTVARVRGDEPGRGSARSAGRPDRAARPATAGAAGAPRAGGRPGRRAGRRRARVPRDRPRRPR